MWAFSSIYLVPRYGPLRSLTAVWPWRQILRSPWSPIAADRQSAPPGALAATPSPRTVRQLALSWGVGALLVGEVASTDEIVWFAVQAAVREGFASPGDVVVVLAGSPTEPEPTTDTLRLVRVR